MVVPMLARTPEARRSERRWMQRDAEILFEAHSQPIRCVIHDMSEGGARIGFKAPVTDLPILFTLVLFRNCVQRNCRVVWRNGRFVGVKFVSKWFGAKLSVNPISAFVPTRPYNAQRLK
jgi:hypothetical protein